MYCVYATALSSLRRQTSMQLGSTVTIRDASDVSSTQPACCRRHRVLTAFTARQRISYVSIHAPVNQHPVGVISVLVHRPHRPHRRLLWQQIAHRRRATNSTPVRRCSNNRDPSQWPLTTVMVRESVPHLSALKACSRRGTIQIHVYLSLTLPYIATRRRRVIEAVTDRHDLASWWTNKKRIHAQRWRHWQFGGIRKFLSYRNTTQCCRHCGRLFRFWETSYWQYITVHCSWLLDMLVSHKFDSYFILILQLYIRD